MRQTYRAVQVTSPGQLGLVKRPVREPGSGEVRGRMVVVGVPPDPITISASQLVFGHRMIEGSLTGSAIDIQDTLAFSVLQDIRPMIEAMPLQQAAEAYARMMRNEARFHLVLTMES